MYRQSAFREDRLETLHALIAAHPLATLVTAGADGLNAKWQWPTLCPSAAFKNRPRCPLLARTSLVASHMSAFDPKRTSNRGAECLRRPRATVVINER